MNTSNNKFHISIIVILVICFCLYMGHTLSNTLKQTETDTKYFETFEFDEEINDIPYRQTESDQQELEEIKPTEPECEEAEQDQSQDLNETDSNYYNQNTYYEDYSGYDNSFKSAGVVYGQDGIRYTWYSQRVLPGGGLTDLNNNGRHVNENGYVCDSEGYIAISSSDHAQGEIIDTPFGPGKVYDSGCASGTIDIYTDF